MALIRVCDICDGKIYNNKKFYKIDYGSEGDAVHDSQLIHSGDRTIHLEICNECFKTIIDACKKKEAVDDN